MTRDVFNFSIPSSTSYAVMIAFLHAQKLGAKRALVSLDFFSFNINFPIGAQFSERRFVQSASTDFAQYLDETLPAREKIVVPVPPPAAEWNEQLYIAVNQDVAAAIESKEFTSGRDHWERAGRAEGRAGVAPPTNWDEIGYLQAQPDVAKEVGRKTFVSGYHHYHAAGRAEGRIGGLQPPDWNEAGYLAANPDVRARVALGIYRNGFVHYAAVGRQMGFVGGLPTANAVEHLKLRFPRLDKMMFKVSEFAQLVFAPKAIRVAFSTISRQSEGPDFNDVGMRVWAGRDEVLRKLGGTGKMIRGKLALGGGSPWFLPRSSSTVSETPQPA
jgi:hypothetical protein